MTDVILDARMIRHTGIGTYVRGLAGEYARHSFFKENVLGLALPPSLMDEANGQVTGVPFRSPIYSPWEQAEYVLRLRQCRLWHSPHYNLPLLKPSGVRLVVTVHDLIHWIFRKEFFSPIQASYAQFFFRRIAQIADQIIAVSQRTKDDLVQHFQVPEEKIRVIYEGVDDDFFQAVDPAEKRTFLQSHGLPSSFFLYVGLLKPHKNVHRLVRVYKKLRSEGVIQTPLVLVGRKDKSYPKGYEMTQEMTSGDGIFYLSAVHSQRELRSLYASARALIHPSLYEGFGLTCLEAMAAGTPVAASQAASLPEVVGEAGLYFDPYSDDSMAEAVVRMEQDGEFRSELARRGRERARRFSWKQAAEETIQIYQALLGEKVYDESRTGS